MLVSGYNHPMNTAYNSTESEETLYKKWEDSGAFQPKDSGEPFTIIMPPPNANDPLHVGHALFVAIEDMLVRYHRMKGDSTVWIPGTDHAGIETQFVYEKKLAKDGKSRFDFDRETLYQKIWDYVEQNSGGAVTQMKRLGASADWSRFTFTLDPLVVDFVVDTFIKLHTDKLVYREEKLVNYCVKCGTGYSELEIEYEERIDPLYYIKYPLHGSDGEFVTVATVRPEPIFADTHLAVNPTGKTKQHLIGKQVENPLTGALMDIISDEFVDPEFGTGVVKLTPAHDANDFLVAQKHGLPINHAVTMWGKMTENAGAFAGLKVAEARKQIVELLAAKGLIEKVNEKYSHRVGTCYRCHSVIEPLPLPQFFISVGPLTKRALESLDKKETIIHGAGRDKILRTWLNNLKDWNVSRQIVWGIRLPVWYDTQSNPNISITFVTRSGEKVRGTLELLLKDYSLGEIKDGLQSLIAPNRSEFVISKVSPGENFLQETDTFDTWFSSGQWTVVTLKTKSESEFEKYYPTNVMETGYDILPFWVMRMMMLCIYLTDATPFKEVYLHGLVRDEQGRKMSKSVGNVINPIDLVEKYGADALRMALTMSTTPGQDNNIGESKVKGMRNFSNKIWNATRYIYELRNSEMVEGRKYVETSGARDDEFNTKVADVSREVTEFLEKLKPGQAAEAIYGHFWHWFCDEMIEAHKKGELSTEALSGGMEIFLKLLHPFAPFVTEAAYQEVFAKDENDLLISSSWPAL